MRKRKYEEKGEETNEKNYHGKRVKKLKKRDLKKNNTIYLNLNNDQNINKKISEFKLPKKPEISNSSNDITSSKIAKSSKKHTHIKTLLPDSSTSNNKNEIVTDTNLSNNNIDTKFNIAKKTWRIQLPAQIQLCGPSQAGKSYKVIQIIKESNRIFEHDINQIIYISPLSPHHDNEEEGAGFARQTTSSKELSIKNNNAAIEGKNSNSSNYNNQGLRLALGSQNTAKLKNRIYQKALRIVCDQENKLLFVTNKLLSLDEVKEIYPEGRVLIVIDDMMCMKSLAGLDELSSMDAHHGNLTVLYS